MRGNCVRCRGRWSSVGGCSGAVGRGCTYKLSGNEYPKSKLNINYVIVQK